MSNTGLSFRDRVATAEKPSVPPGVGKLRIEDEFVESIEIEVRQRITASL